MNVFETIDGTTTRTHLLVRLSLVVPLLLVTGCFFPYVYHEQSRVLVTSVDVDATLKIAEMELKEGGFDATLTIWALRDQIVTSDNAKLISELYFRYIDKVAAEKDKRTADFGVWHFAWAVSNFYRNGDAGIKAELEGAYTDALKRPDTLNNFKKFASEHVDGSKVYMGDIHAAARSYARSHIVAPGNKKYLQSIDEFTRKRRKK